jgi:hypothetical protein
MLATRPHAAPARRPSMRIDAFDDIPHLGALPAYAGPLATPGMLLVNTPPAWADTL